MIKNIVFDIGNVLLTFKPVEYMKKLGYSNDSIEKLHSAIFENRYWKELDRGTCSLNEARQIMISENIKLEKDINIILSNRWMTMLEPILDTVCVAQSLKDNGYKLYLLSNFHKEAIEYVKNKNDFFELFDGGIVSCHVNKIKPEIEIYKALLDSYMLTAEETIFIDDMQINLDSAKTLHINTILFKDANNLRNDLINLKVRL